MRLFKYVNPDRIDILQNKMVRFTQPASLNDPFELSPNMKKLVSEKVIDKMTGQLQQLGWADEEDALIVYNELCEYQPLFLLFGIDAVKDYPFQEARVRAREATRESLRGIIDRTAEYIRLHYPLLRDQLHNRFGILSLSEKNDNLLMWAHYAQSHSGFLLEVDSSHPELDQSESFSGLIGRPQKVSYSNERPLLQVRNSEMVTELEMVNLAQSFFLTKSEEWSYEKEWRMILPVTEPVHLVPFPPACLTGIIFGSRMTADNKTKIRTRLTSQPEFAHVRLQQAIIDPLKFQVNIVDYIP